MISLIRWSSARAGAALSVPRHRLTRFSINTSEHNSFALSNYNAWRMSNPQTASDSEIALVEEPILSSSSSSRNSKNTKALQPKLRKADAPKSSLSEKDTEPRVSLSCSINREYTWDEISLHNSADDCWLVAKGIVYDVTSFLSDHPAGPKSILRHGGTDATEDFNFHSKSARAMWKPFEIGRVAGQSSCVIS